jgi:hydroxyacylglutathione hydrolase
MKSWETKSGHKVIQILSGRSNVFLLTNGEKNFLIDTSPAYKWNDLKKSLSKNNINNIDYLLLTHSHYDHADNASRIQDQFSSLVILHRDEEYNLKTGEMSSPGGTNHFTRFIVNHLAPGFAHRLRCNPCQPDILIDEVYELNRYGFNAYIMHTPGHSPGSLSVIVDDEIALVGDTMFGVFKSTVFPPYADDVGRMVKSWGRLLETGCIVFLPGHGGAKYRDQLQKEYDKRKQINQSF